MEADYPTTWSSSKSRVPILHVSKMLKFTIDTYKIYIYFLNALKRTKRAREE